MPDLVPILKNLIGTAIQLLLGGNTSGVIKGTFETIANALNDIYRAISLITWAQEAQFQAIQHNKGSIANTGAAWNATTVEYNIALNHIIDTIIPNTGQFTYGKIQSEQITPLKQRLFGDELTIAGMQGTLRSDDGWIQETGKVWIDWLRKFYDQNYNDIIGVVYTWQSWFQNPGLFGAWAAAPIVGPLVAYLADPQHSQTRDNLVELLIDASPDRFRHVENAALAVLQSTYP